MWLVFKKASQRFGEVFKKRLKQTRFPRQHLDYRFYYDVDRGSFDGSYARRDDVTQR
jgi:hypothetical protein